MPTYKFFEVRKGVSKGQAEFTEFSLRTSSRSEARKRHSMPASEGRTNSVEGEVTFKARKVPDFSQPMTGVSLVTPKKLTNMKPFSLSTT